MSGKIDGSQARTKISMLIMSLFYAMACTAILVTVAMATGLAIVGVIAAIDLCLAVMS
jgi:hypothetical protein